MDKPEVPRSTCNIAFQPAIFENVTLKTKLVRSAIEMFSSKPDGHVADCEFDFYEETSSEPFGLIISAHTCVSPEGRTTSTQNAIWSDEFIPDQKRLAKIAKKHDAKAFMQLGHGGRKADPSVTGLPVYTPDNMSKEQIKATANAFAAAAKRAKECGFDGVQLHTAHLYLLSQFFYPEFNHRTDEYGGSAENRFRIVREISEAVKKSCGDAFPVFMKINATDRQGTEQYFSDIVKVLQLCEKSGIEAVEISGFDANPAGIPSGMYFYETALHLMEHTDVPLMLVGGIRTADDIDRALSSGIKTVSFARPVIRDSRFLSKLFDGEKCACISCNRCFGISGGEKQRCIFLK